MRRAAAALLAAAACGAPSPEPDAAAPPDASTVVPTPLLLSATGLYEDIAARRLAADVIEFAPRHELWSDGARKRRFLRLPPGARIDTSEMAHWGLPRGAEVFKEFRAPDGTYVETRRIFRAADTGDPSLDLVMGSYVWRPGGTDAVYAPEGAEDVGGTGLDVPAATRCPTCHRGEPGLVLGLSALQLDGTGPPGARLGDLAARGLLSAPPPPGATYPVPGDAVTREALGYLHANCGPCHNPRGSAWPDVSMTLALDLDARSPEDTTIWKALVGVALYRFHAAGYDYRVVPGAPGESAVIHRMGTRLPGQAMPPFATELVDGAGVAAVSAWIAALPAGP